MLLNQGACINATNNYRTNLQCAIQNENIEVTKLLLEQGANVNALDNQGRTPLQAAVQMGCLKIVEHLLNYKPQINYPCSSNLKKGCKGYTPLHFAVENGNVEITRLLLSRGAEVDVKGKNSITPLHIAAREGHVCIAEDLLNYGACITFLTCKEIYTPLHFAVENGNEEITKLLLSRGAEVDVKSKNSITPLHIAARKGHVYIAENLLNYGACIHSLTHKELYTPLHFAVENGNGEITRLLLSRGAEVDGKSKNSITPLHIAARKGYICIAEDLLNSGACINSLTCKERYTPLHFAVENGNGEITRLLLSSGAEVDVKSKNSITPLHIAAKKGHVCIAEDLLNYGACINSSTCREMYAPLHFACERGPEEAVQLFLCRGADVESSAKGNLTPLHIAIKRVEKTVVKLLLQYGANVDYENKDGKTILHLAVESGCLMIVNEILRYCPDIENQSYRSSLIIAMQRCREKYGKIVEALLEYGILVDPENVNNPELLHTAVKIGYLKFVAKLLNNGADVNILHNSMLEEGFTPLHSATKYEQEDVLELLISNGADINAQDKTGKTPIFYAINNTNSKIVHLLLTNGANVNDPELLSLAVRKDCIEITEDLLEHDADIEGCDICGRTALHFTALDGTTSLFEYTFENRDINIKAEIAKLLLSKGANVDAQTKNGLTTLAAAAKKGYTRVVEALLEYNANVNVKQADGSAALHMAVDNNHGEVVKMLLECGAEVDAKTKRGLTPLSLAVRESYREIIKIILKFGADINSRDENGKTALHIASQNGDSEVVATLLPYGCDVNITTEYNQTPLDLAMAEERLLYGEIDYYDSDADCFLDPDRDISSFEVIIQALKCHIIKMKSAHLYVCQSLQSISCGMNHFQEKCEQEIANMMTEKVKNANLSFYEILTKDINWLEIYMRNETIVQVLESQDYKTKFPLYAAMLDCQFRKSMKRKELLEKSIKFFHNIFPELLYDCTEEIFSFLDNEDLKNVIFACESPSVNCTNC